MAVAVKARYPDLTAEEAEQLGQGIMATVRDAIADPGTRVAVISPEAASAWTTQIEDLARLGRAGLLNVPKHTDVANPATEPDDEEAKHKAWQKEMHDRLDAMGPLEEGI